MPEGNRHTVTATAGPFSKGPLAVKFGLHVFVDDRVANLRAINDALVAQSPDEPPERLLLHFIGDPVAQRRGGTSSAPDESPGFTVTQAATWEQVVRLCREAWPRLCGLQRFQ